MSPSEGRRWIFERIKAVYMYRSGCISMERAKDLSPVTLLIVDLERYICRSCFKATDMNGHWLSTKNKCCSQFTGTLQLQAGGAYYD